MIYDHPPAEFNSQFDVVGCIVECQGKILLLHRHDHKPEGNTWCLPAGKREGKETVEQAVKREVLQETGMYLTRDQLTRRGLVYVRYSDYDFTYTVYYARFAAPPTIRLAPDEHKDWQWVTPTEALTLNLIRDEAACLQRFLVWDTA